MPAPDRSCALDNIVVVLFENRSLDNVLGRLYGPDDGKSFDWGDRQGPEQSNTPAKLGLEPRHNSTTPPPNPHLRTSSKSSDTSPGNTAPSSPATVGNPHRD